MCPRDRAKVFWTCNAEKAPELPEVILIGFARIGITQISKPLDFRGNISEFDELRRRERPPLLSSNLYVVHRYSSFPAADYTRDKALYEGSSSSQTVVCLYLQFMSK